MKTLLFLIIALLLLNPLGYRAQPGPTALESASVPALPLNIPPDSVKFLRDLIDPGLQARLQQEIDKNAKWKRLVDGKRMAIGVVDLSDPYNAKYARLNGNVMMYAASLPKIGILLAVEDALISRHLCAMTPPATSSRSTQAFFHFTRSAARWVSTTIVRLTGT